MIDTLFVIGMIGAMFALTVLVGFDALFPVEDDDGHQDGGRICPPKDQGRPW